ncbi:SIMPL domain-containing protein [Pseudocnuella soli]|uniref:SIMPL domain-containing protein n=1 Tax=Pseudocnuella soli TaxID=2502779 RepID=UPI001051335A|nr:SIMPL domain-containing protein [Pseudocnuella soli]
MKQMMILFFAALISLGASAQQSNQGPRLINVQAAAEMEIVPDEVWVQVQLQEYDKKGTGKVNIEKISNAFLAKMKGLGLTEKEVSLQNASGYDNYWQWYRKNKQKTPDMKASISYILKLNSVRQLEQVVQALDDEATQNFYIQKVSHSKIEDYRNELKMQALKNAQAKASLLAGAVNAKVGAVWQINEPTENNYQPQMMMRMEKASMDAGGEPALNVDFKKMKLRFEAPVSFVLVD